MRHRLFAGAVTLSACFGTAIFRPPTAQTPSEKQADTTRRPPLFSSDTPLAITITTNIKQLRHDRNDKAPYRSATVSYVGDDGKTVTVPIRVKTHGIWRLKNCDLPPLRLNISNKETKHTLFYDLQKPKLTSPCRDNDGYEQYVLQEMQLYRIYQVITPVSHRVRALRVTYVDSASGKTQGQPRYAFLFEDPDELADRFGGKMLKTKGAGPSDLDEDQAAITYLFQYLIANTDFSFAGLHNGELIIKPDGSALLPVAYDFDFSGAVNARYATVDPSLRVKRVRERLYRGYCVLAPQNPAAIALFQQKKSAIYALYRDDVGKLLEPGIVKETLEYFDEFYDAIKTQRDAERYVFDSCLGRR